MGLTEARDDDGSVEPVDEATWLWPCLRVLPMGWSWSLYFCHSVLVDAMVASEMQRASDSESEVGRRVVVDRTVPATIAPGRPLLCPYVDNANFLGWTAADAQHAATGFADHLESVGLAFRLENDASEEAEVLGLIIDGPRREIRPKPL